MHIQWILVEHLPPLEYVYLDCNKRVNLFIGTNATGKSTILRAIENLSSSWGLMTNSTMATDTQFTGRDIRTH